MSGSAVLSIGEVLWDMFPDAECFGGAPANLACQAALQGARVLMVTAVGDDDRGRAAVAMLRGFGVEVELVQTLIGRPTGTVGVALDTASRPTFTIHEHAAWDELAWTDTLAQRVSNVAAVAFGTLGQRSATTRDTIQRCLRVARDAGIHRFLDVNLRPPFVSDELIRDSVGLASLLKLSDTELPAVTRACGLPEPAGPEQQLEHFRVAYGIEAVVMTRGPRGAVAATEAGICDQPGLPTDVVDTVGAGDAFSAAFLVGWLRGQPLPQLLLQACRHATATCGHAGAVPALPAAAAARLADGKTSSASPWCHEDNARRH